jgi:glycosyltransferase involved in cell wall biosynthesis
LTFPRVLIVSDTSISKAHGTGRLVMRHFSHYPQHRLANAYLNSSGECFCTPSHFNTRRFGRTQIGTAQRFAWAIYQRVGRRPGLARYTYLPKLSISPKVSDVILDRPDVIYSVVFSETGLALTDALCTHFDDVPMIQYFLDYQLPHGIGRHRYVKQVMNRAAETWALTEKIASAIQPFSERPVILRPGFHIDMPPRSKHQHREATDPDFTCIIIGNFWSLDTIPVTKGLWQRASAKHPNLKSIRWYGHLESVERLNDTFGDIGPEIEYAGFLDGQEMIDALMEADLALVPFNVTASAEHDYARYSLPSRLTELLAVGVPIFCIASADTPVAHYLSHNMVGVTGDAQNPEGLADRVCRLIESRSSRLNLSRNARSFAEHNFELVPFQQFLYSKLKSLNYSCSEVPGEPCGRCDL